MLLNLSEKSAICFVSRLLTFKQLNFFSPKQPAEQKMTERPNLKTYNSQPSTLNVWGQNFFFNCNILKSSPRYLGDNLSTWI